MVLSRRTLRCMRLACLAAGLLWMTSAAADSLYRLPWADARSFIFTQVPGGQITSHFTKATSHAVDIAMPQGVAIVAARAGVVEALEARHGRTPNDEPITYEGNFVRVRHADGTAATYAHLKHRGVAVAVGERVESGQFLGYSGGSGDVEAPHLHFVVTRTEKNSAGWMEEVSLPVRFYVGAPPLAFTPRPAVRAMANYSGPADMPRAPSETPGFAWKPPERQPGDEVRALGVLLFCLGCGIAGLAWFWRFSSS